MRYLWLIIWVLGLHVGMYMWSKSVNSCCNSEAQLVEKVAGPLLFSCNEAEPILGDDFDIYRDSIAGILNEYEGLEITGHYRPQAESEKVGLDRAQSVALLFYEVLDSSKVVTNAAAQDVPCEDKNAFESVSFTTKTMSKNIVETDNSTLIYFPFNSTRKLNAADVNAYLDNLANRVIESGEIVNVIGHTDNIGSSRSNKTLGRKRARIIREYLRSKGVSRKQIRINSMGETEPIADNSTPEGREKNRRTEIIVE